MRLNTRPSWVWHLRIHWQTGNFGPLFIATLVAATILAVTPLQVVAPQLRTIDETTAPTALVIAGILGILIQTSLNEPSPEIFATAISKRKWSPTIRVLTLLAAFTAAVAALAPQHFLPALVIVLTTCAEAILCGWVVGHRLAWILPGTHAAASALLGAATLHGLAWWAWPADPTPTPGAVLLPSVILIMALTLERTKPRIQKAQSYDE